MKGLVLLNDIHFLGKVVGLCFDPMSGMCKFVKPNFKSSMRYIVKREFYMHVPFSKQDLIISRHFESNDYHCVIG